MSTFTTYHMAREWGSRVAPKSLGIPSQVLGYDHRTWAWEYSHSTIRSDVILLATPARAGNRFEYVNPILLVRRRRPGGYVQHAWCSPVGEVQTLVQSRPAEVAQLLDPELHFIARLPDLVSEEARRERLLLLLDGDDDFYLDEVEFYLRVVDWQERFVATRRVEVPLDDYHSAFDRIAAALHWAPSRYLVTALTATDGGRLEEYDSHLFRQHVYNNDYREAGLGIGWKVIRDIVTPRAGDTRELDPDNPDNRLAETSAPRTVVLGGLESGFEEQPCSGASSSSTAPKTQPSGSSAGSKRRSRRAGG